MEGKRFYLDVKENQRGRFIKIAEMSADGRKENNECNFVKTDRRVGWAFLCNFNDSLYLYSLSWT